MGNKKHLPIRIFQKRHRVDESFKEAGGSGDLPSWTKSGEELEFHAKELGATLDDFETTFGAKTNKGVPSTIQIHLHEKAYAKSHRSELRKLFDVKKKNNILGFYSEDSVLVKVDNVEDLHAIKAKFSQHDKNAHGLSSILEMHRFEVELIGESNGIKKVKLMDYHSHELNQILRRSFEANCKENNIKFRSQFYTPDLIVYEIDTNEEHIASLLTLDGIKSIGDMATYDLTTDEFEGECERVEVNMPEEGVEYPVVGVLDSGIERSLLLSPWLESRNHKSFTDEDIDNSHGSSVASIIVHGDALQREDYTNTKGCRIFDATVLPKMALKDTVEEFDLIEHIRDAISSNSEIKIWNMSIGWGLEVKDDQISDIGAALDHLQHEYGVLICTSAGNCTNFEKNEPKGRIQCSADSVRALVVGSLAHAENTNSHAKIDEPSPFSRAGSGPFNLVKPDLTHYGGNIGIDSSGHRDLVGVNIIKRNGDIGQTVGTSFSTPRISSIAAGLSNTVDGEFDPLLIRALILHSSKYPDVGSMSQDDKMKYMGYGVPRGVHEILHNADNEITLVMSDTIEKGNFIEILDFPFPDDMIEDGYFHGEVVITLVSDPKLADDQGEEYCQSNVDVYFGTYDDKTEREGPTIKNEIGKDNAKNILAPGLYGARKVSQNQAFGSERILKSYHQKFQPVKKWAVDLDDMTDGNKKKYLEYPKKWYLKIEALFRDHIEKTESVINTEFCLLITIRDGKNGTKVYDNVVNGLEANNFVQNSIGLRNQINLGS